MTAQELREEINIELDLIETTLRELLALYKDVGEKEPSVREKTASGAFLAQFYCGIENTLKRISHFNSIPLPTGETWHIDLFKRFCEPPYKPLPVLFDESLALSMTPFRKFRHVVYHGYGSRLDWDAMREGIVTIEDTFLRFKSQLFDYLQRLEKP